MDKFFFSPLVEDFDRFGLLSCLLPYSVSLCVVPLLECTSSINAVKGEKERNQSYSDIINEDTRILFCKSLTLNIKAFIPRLAISHPVNPRL